MLDRGMNITLVEDDASLRQAMQRMLQAVGCLVTSCESSEDFLEISSGQARLCDCLVLDNCLPGMSGLDLCRSLLATGSSTPYILITGCDKPGLRDLAIHAGARDYLLKPFAGATLLDAIGRAVTTHL